ncbi:ABC transporter permease [Hugenholtzia roseola]|uniref:ABC transporter permease n=1 Tax=Hugenholtzia roseola TaxID=1002 RepID=UPI0003F5BC02|nr:ABC transporter permease [Hugenholtzia roseola]
MASFRQIRLIFWREYLVRVRKLSFWVTALLMPLLLVGMGLIPILIDYLIESERRVYVLDQTGKFSDAFTAFDAEEAIVFEFAPDAQNLKIEPFLDSLYLSKQTDYDAILIIPPDLHLENPTQIRLIAEKTVPLVLQKKIERKLANHIETLRLSRLGIDSKVLAEVQTKVSLTTQALAQEEKQTSSAFAMGLGYGGALLIYFFIFLFGTMVMKAVSEEKTNRIIEVLIASVKPFELMMGKIMGIAAVALSKFVLWVLLGMGVFTALGLFIGAKGGSHLESLSAIEKTDNFPTESLNGSLADPNLNALLEVQAGIRSLDWLLILPSFFFFFLFGYLFYAALSAAIGALLDNESDNQHLTLPITLPLIAGFLIASAVVNDPESSLAFWASMIPFTSPIVMLVRIPFGVAAWELGLSMTVLVLSFFVMVWVAARIYRIGILSYGKKIGYKDLWRWVLYQEK